jgi:hypothetical protein
MLRRSFVRTTLLLGTMLSSLAYAATTDTLRVGGTVPPRVQAAPTPTGAASRLDLATPGAQVVRISEIPLDTNDPSGLTVTVTSGSLTSLGGRAIAYQVTSVAHGASAPAAAAFTVPSGSTYTMSTSVAGSAGADLYMRYTSAAGQEPGLYDGWIRVTVCDN